MKLSTIIYCLIIMVISSCGNRKLTAEYRKSLYFQGDTKKIDSAAVTEYEPIIQKGDNLLIITNSLDRNTDVILNMPSTLGSASMGGGATAGYLVDFDGNIQVPQLGTVKAAGLSKSQLQANLLEKLKEYVKDPVVNIRFLNYKINILGEVNKPGQYPISNDKPTLIDAVGMAGDLTIFGRRDSVWIYREFNGKREVGVVNLNSMETFNSPYFYLRQNDVVYVMPNNRKIENVDQKSQRNIQFTTSVISTIALLTTTLATIINFSK